ncbi:MAG: hypothetical protein Q9219_003204 [cf. Caloplaca sp. 3 TL-2023]
MEVHAPLMDHPKKRRRRRKNERSPLSATLIPDTDLDGEVGFLSADLNRQLFPGPAASSEGLRCVAVSPWAPEPSGTYQDHSWTILPVKVGEAQPEWTDPSSNPTITCPVSSSVLQSLFRGDSSGRNTKEPVVPKKGARILVLDIEPVKLTDVYVSVDGDALARHEQIQRKFGGGFGSFRKDSQSSKGKGKGKASLAPASGAPDPSAGKEQEKILTDAVRSALGSISIVRQHALLPLPLPAHPITHVPLPPAKIIMCEPVSQGLLSADTKIIVDRRFSAGKKSSASADGRSWDYSPQAVLEDGEDTSNEQFFSALEDDADGLKSQGLDEDSESPSSSSEEDSSSESDVSPDNFISMSTPSISHPSSSLVSSFVPTPKARGSVKEGTSTPGSVLSNFTSMTAHQSPGVARPFQARCLLAPIPDVLLHPKPIDGEDEQSRVYVDVKDLLRLKCFSGDWVQLRASSHPHKHHLKSWDLNTSQADNDQEDEFRAVKIYGLPDLAPRTSVHSSRKEASFRDRRSSVNSSLYIQRPAPQVWLSPIVFANLDCPAHVRLAPFPRNDPMKHSFSPKRSSNKMEHPRYPPTAVEVSLAKVSTPISQEAALQDMVFFNLKRYFEAKRRIVKGGDLIAMTIDADLGRMFGPFNATAEGGKEREEVLSLLTDMKHPNNRSLEVIWFKVGQVTGPPSGKEARDRTEEIWGGAASVDHTTTRMTIGASQQCKIPSDTQVPWKLYLGVMPRAPTEDNAGPLTIYTSMSPRPHTTTLQRRLRELTAAATSPRATHLGIQPTLILLYSNQRHIGKARVATQAASDCGVHTFQINAYDVISDGNTGEVQESSINTRIARALSCGAQHTTILVRHLEAFTSNKVIAALQEAAKKVRVLIATTTQLDQVPKNLRSLFTHEIEMSAPDEGEREGIIQNIIIERGIRIARDVDLKAVAVKTAALVAGNLVDIVERAVIAREIRLENFLKALPVSSEPDSEPPPLVRDLVVSGGDWARCVTKDDFDLAVDAARKNFADAIGAPKIPNVSWDDVGGLENVKDTVMETIQLPLERPELFAKGMKKRSGILFYGPPGTGKTLLAKAIATEFSLNFFSVKGPELLNMYIGESEANVRRVFQRARDARPCVVFFDELDSVAPKRGNQGDSGGVMDRIVSQLLAELDGMSDGDDGGGGGGVFVIGATNRPDLLDQALLRPGRFDKMLYLGISDTHQKQLTILEALTRKFTLHPDLDLARVAESLPFTYTGADLYALCSDAMLKAITRQARAVDAKIQALPGGAVSHAYFFDRMATEEDVAVVVGEGDFDEARRELVGSVSAKELEHYQTVRRSFESPPPPPPPPPPTSSSPTPTPTPTIPPTRPFPTKRSNTAIRSQPRDPKTPISPSPQQQQQQQQQHLKHRILEKNYSNRNNSSNSTSDEDEEDDDDEAYLTTSEDSVRVSPERRRSSVMDRGIERGSEGKDSSGKGKGKGKATMIPRPVDGYG